MPSNIGKMFAELGVEVLEYSYITGAEGSSDRIVYATLYKSHNLTLAYDVTMFAKVDFILYHRAEIRRRFVYDLNQKALSGFFNAPLFMKQLKMAGNQKIYGKSVDLKPVESAFLDDRVIRALRDYKGAFGNDVGLRAEEHFVHSQITDLKSLSGDMLDAMVAVSEALEKAMG